MKVTLRNINELAELYTSLKGLYRRKHLLKINIKNVHVRCTDYHYEEMYPNAEQHKLGYWRSELYITVKAITKVKEHIWNLKHPMGGR